MLELWDSTAALGRVDELTERLRLDGYLFFRGLLEPDPLRTLHLRMLTTLRARGWIDPDGPLLSARARPPARLPGSAAYYEGYSEILALEDLHRVGHDPRLGGLFRGLIGPDAYCLPAKVVRLWYPGFDHMVHMPSAPHQDLPAYHIPDQLTAWIPLMNCPCELGGLRVLRGSQGRGTFDPVGHEPVVDPDDRDWATTDYRVGDVLLFHCLTLHHAMRNRTPLLRVSVDVRWASARYPIPRHATLPDVDVERVPGWDVLTAGWTTTKWIETPGEVRIDDGIEPFARPNHGPSRFVDIPPEPRWDLVPVEDAATP